MGLPGIFLGSRVFLALSWTTLEKVPRDIALWRRLCLAVKPTHVGAMWTGYPTPCSVLPSMGVRRWERVVCHVLSYPVAAVGGGIFSGDVKPSGLDIWWC
jgi:hypothetical protein